MADEVFDPQLVAGGDVPVAHCDAIVENIRKLLAPFSGAHSNNGKQNETDSYSVLLRRVPVTARDVSRHLLRGEVMDFIVQHIDDAKLPYSVAWKIARECADNIYQRSDSETQQINALNDAAKRELENVCRELQEKSSLIEEGVAANLNGVSPFSPSGISVKASRNARKTMEDRHVIIPDLSVVAPNLKTSAVHYEYYAVFDGHGGRDAANFAAAHLHVILADHLAQGCDPVDALQKAFLQVDNDYCNSLSDVSRNHGSTAVVALMSDRRKLYIAWLGDSEAVLARAGSAHQLVVPHKPSLASEQKRIEELGGAVAEIQGISRVNGNLAVSRSIGDKDHKPFVSSEPDFKVVDLDDECDFLVLGCDGLFDQMTSNEVVSHAYHAALSLQFDTTNVADQLTRAAISKGSTDNITTIMLNLRDPKKWKYEAVVFSSQTQAATTCRVEHAEQLLECPKEETRLNGNSSGESPCCDAEISKPDSFAGGDASPVREVAADFVHSAVEMALNKVNNNGVPGTLELEPCDLSPPEGEQRDLMATLKNETPESERLNPEAPEFVPFGVSIPPVAAAAAAAADTSEAAAAVDATDAEVQEKVPASPLVPPVVDAMPKSESRDELVYEIDRQISVAPQPAKAELVQIDDFASPPPASGAAITTNSGGGGPEAPEPSEGDRQLSDSEEEPNSMVVHEDQPQVEISPPVNMDVKLSELIVRDQTIHVIPEESPNDEVAPPILEQPAEKPLDVSASQPGPVPESEPLPEQPLSSVEGVPISEQPSSSVNTVPLPEQPLKSEETQDSGPADVSQRADLITGSTDNVESKEDSVQSKEDSVQSKEDNVQSKEDNFESKEKNIESEKENVDSKETNVESKEELSADVEASTEEAPLPEEAKEVVADVSAQLVQEDLLNLIESTSGQPAAACVSVPSVLQPQLPTGADYLFSVEAGCHEEVIIPQSQPLLYDGDEQQQEQQQEAVEQPAEKSTDSLTLIDSMMNNMTIDDGPKIVDAVEKEPIKLPSPIVPAPSQPLEDLFVASEQSQEPEKCIDLVSVAPVPASEEQSEVVSGQPDSLKLGSIQDIMEKLSPSETEEEAKTGDVDTHEAVQLIPDSLPEAEGVQDADSESDNDAQEWKYVKTADSKPEPQQAIAGDESKPATDAIAAAAAAVGVATAAAVAVSSAAAEPKPAPAKSAKAVGAKAPAKSGVTTKPTPAARTQTGPKTAPAAPKATTAKVSPSVTKAPSASVKSAAEKSTAPAAKVSTSRSAPSTTAKPSVPGAAKTSTNTAKSSTVKAVPSNVRAAVKPAPAKPASAPASSAVPKTAAVKTSSTAVKASPSKAAPNTASPVKTAAVRPATTRIAGAGTTKTQMSQPAKPPSTEAKKATTAPKVAANKVPTSSSTVTSKVASTRAPTAKPATVATKKAASGAAPTGAASRVAAARAAASARPAPKANATEHKPKTTDKASTGVKSTAAALPKSPMKKAVKQQESQKVSKTSVASTDAKEAVAENHHQEQNGTHREEVLSVPSPQTNGHADKVEPPSEQAPQTVVEQV